MTARSASDLAADVRAGASFYMAHRGKESPHPNAPELTVWEHAADDPECPGCKASASLDELVARLETAEAERDAAWIGSQIALCEEFVRAAKNDETFGVEDIEAKLILLTQAER